MQQNNWACQTDQQANNMAANAEEESTSNSSLRQESEKCSISSAVSMGSDNCTGEVQNVTNEGVVQCVNSDTCQNCSQSIDVISYCKDCYLVLCETCSSEHKLLKCFSAHEILQKDEFFTTALNSKDEICVKHNLPLFLYCLTCDCCVCQTCRIESEHQNHSFKLVSDYLKEDVTAEFDQQINQLQKMMDSLKQEREDVLLEAEREKRKIELQAQSMIDKLMEYERQICETVDSEMKKKVKTLDEQEEDAKAMLKELHDCEQYVELSLQYGSPEYILMEKEKLAAHIERVVQKAQQKSYEPLVEADFTITRN